MKRLLFALAVVFAISLLTVLYQLAQNGRYQFSPSGRTILDTHTGAIYQPSGESATSALVTKPIE